MSRWFTFPRPNTAAHVRLFCFPYSGGGSALFRTWVDGLPATVEVCAVELPGRGARLREAPFTRLVPLVHEIADAIIPLLDRRFAFFGHSLGALVCFELARQLRRDQQPLPAHLLVSGASAPQAICFRRCLHQLPDAELIETLREFNGTPREVFESRELMEIMLPIIRADFALGDTYTYSDEPALDCPLSVFGGIDDAHVPRAHLEAWRQQTSAEFSLWMLPGDHFFLHEERQRLLAIVSEDLERLSAWSRRGVGASPPENVITSSQGG